MLHHLIESLYTESVHFSCDRSKYVELNGVKLLTGKFKMEKPGYFSVQ